jgi:hypothetical protein
MARFEGPFIFKVRFYKPEGKNALKNSAHINYIATRPGVAIDDENGMNRESDILTNENNNVENNGNEWFNEDHAHMQVEHGSEDGNSIDPGTAAGHIKYADERPGSHGLFDQEGSNPNLLEIQKELREHDGLVWRSILSLKENDAIKLGFTEKQRWEDTLRASVTEAAGHMKIKESNLRWVAAYHAEEGHPHAHLVMWEKEPKRDRGMLSKGEKEDVKRTFMREIYAEERTRLHQEKTVNRDIMRDLAKGDLQSYIKLLKEVKIQDLDVALEQRAIGSVEIGLAPKMYRENEKDIVLGLKKVAELMPKSGRIAFQFMNDDVKENALLVADRILSNAFGDSMNGYMNAVEEQTLLHTNEPGKIEQAKQNAYADIQKRVANIVIKAAAEVNRSSYMKVDEIAVEKAMLVFLTAEGKPIQDLTEDTVRAITTHFRMYDFNQEEVQRIFEKWIPQIHIDKGIADIRNIVSNEFENKKIMITTLKDIPITETEVSMISRAVGRGLKHPLETIHFYEATLKSQLEMVNLIKTSIVPIENESEVREIASMLNAALKESGFFFNKRKSLMDDWAENNQVSIDFKELDSSLPKDYKLTKDDWLKLCESLSVDSTTVSWHEKTKSVINQDKTKELYDEFKTITRIPKGEELSYRQLIEKLIPSVSKGERSHIKEMDEWNKLLPESQRFTEEDKRYLTERWKQNDIKNIQTTSSMMTSAGYTRDAVMQKLSPFLKDESVEQLSKYVRTVDIKLSQGRSISGEEFQKVLELTNIKDMKYPYTYQRLYETSEENKQDLMDAFKTSKLTNIEEETVISTSFWMNETLKQSEISEPQRVRVMNQWAENNGVSTTQAYQQLKIGSDKEFNVGRKRWDELCEKLNLGDLRTPWENKSSLVVNKEELQKVVNKVIDVYPTLGNVKEEEKLIVRDFVVKGINVSSSSQSDYANSLNDFVRQLPEVERLSVADIERHVHDWKRNDLDFVQKVLKVENQVEQTIYNYSTVLKTLDLPDEQVKKVITDWAERTSIKLPNDKLEQYLDKGLDAFNEKHAWGQTPTVSKEAFGRLCENLKVESPYLWKSDFKPSNGLIKGLWKSIFNSIEQERMQGQAQAEMQQREIQQQQIKQQRQLQNHNQEQGRER